MFINNNAEFDIKIDSTRENVITEKSSDEDIIRVLQKWSVNDSHITNKIFVDGKRNYLYYTGKYDSDENLPLSRSRVFDNRIFADIKSVVPYVTSKPAEPVVYARDLTKVDIDTDKKKEEESILWEEENGLMKEREEKQEKAKELAMYSQTLLKNVYNRARMQKLNEANAINRYIYKIWVLKTEIRNGEICEKVVNPQLLYLDGEAKNRNEMKYIGERIVNRTAAELVEIFPKKKKEIEMEVGGNMWTKVEVIEWWTRELKITTMRNNRVILEKKKNPLYDYEREEFNYFKEAPFPYNFLNVHNTGKSLIDDTSEIDQTYQLQEALNTLLRQVVDNSKYNGNPIKVFRGVPTTKIEKILSDLQPGKWVTLNRDESIEYLVAPALPGYVTATIDSLRLQIDNAFWAQQTFRGEYEAAQSGSARQVLRAGSENSLAVLSRAIERLMKEKFELWMHIFMIYSDDPDFRKNQIEKVLGVEAAERYFELMYDNPGDGMEIYVQEGSMMPDDKMAQREEAIMLAQYGRISTELLYKRLEIPNPEKEARKTLDEQAETEARASAIQTKAQIEIEAMKQEELAKSEANTKADELIWQIQGMWQGDIWLKWAMQQRNAEAMTDDLLSQIQGWL